MPESLFKKNCRPKACNFIKKENLAQVFSCEFCEISKNTFLNRTPLVAASKCGTFGALLTDFSKAFDYLPRGFMITRLPAYGLDMSSLFM